jgi:hypothetical protein
MRTLRFVRRAPSLPDVIELPADLDLATWEARLREASRDRSVAQRRIGDLLNYGENRYGEAYVKAANATGLSYETIANVKSVVRIVLGQLEAFADLIQIDGAAAQQVHQTAQVLPSDPPLDQEIEPGSAHPDQRHQRKGHSMFDQQQQEQTGTCQRQRIDDAVVDNTDTTYDAVRHRVVGQREDRDVEAMLQRIVVQVGQNTGRETGRRRQNQE